ncbi:hypothetical protein BH20GEM2_BH20GEM2_08910 [soil metagenome]
MTDSENPLAAFEQLISLWESRAESLRGQEGSGAAVRADLYEACAAQLRNVLQAVLPPEGAAAPDPSVLELFERTRAARG